MNQEDVTDLAQLLSTMKELVEKLNISLNKKDNEQVALAKKELLQIQAQIAKIL